MSEGPTPTRLHLRELHWTTTDRCRAIFETDAGQQLETQFAVERRAGIVTASDEASLMQRFDGTAEEARSVIRAVVAFCDAAEPGSGVI